MDQDAKVDDVGARVAEARQELGLSLSALADSLNMSVAELREIESGRFRLDISEVVTLAAALGVSTRRLLGMPEHVFVDARVCPIHDAPEYDQVVDLEEIVRAVAISDLYGDDDYGSWCRICGVRTVFDFQHEPDCAYGLALAWVDANPKVLAEDLDRKDG